MYDTEIFGIIVRDRSEMLTRLHVDFIRSQMQWLNIQWFVHSFRRAQGRRKLSGRYGDRHTNPER